jgi:hypothetical protein
MNPQPVGPARPRSPNDPNLYVASIAYTYETDTLANYASGIAPAGEAVLTFNIANDSDFFWTLFAACAYVGADGFTEATQPIPGVNIMLVNTTTGRQYMSAPVPLANYSGNGRLPFVIPVSTLWEKQSTIQVTLTNVTDNTTYSNIQLSFHGIKAFTRPGVN